MERFAVAAGKRPIVLALLAGACTAAAPRPTPPKTVAPPVVASPPPAAPPLPSRACALKPSRGVVVNARAESLAGYDHALAVGAREIAVVWSELGPPTGRNFPASAAQVTAHVRGYGLDLTPRGPDTTIDAQVAPDSGPPMTSAWTWNDAPAVTACQWHFYRSAIDCAASRYDEGNAVETRRLTRRVRQNSGNLSIGGALVGGAPIVVAGGEFGGVMRIREGGGDERLLRTETSYAQRFDGVSIAVARDGGFFAAWHATLGDVIEASSFDPSGRGGPPERLVSGHPVGAPAARVADDGTPEIYYARRSRSGEPWQIVRTRNERTRALVLGTEPTTPRFAPSVVGAREAGCVWLAWTEGQGRRTVTRAGLVCGDTLTGHPVDLTPDGVEGGQAELAAYGGRVFVVWQEVLVKGAEVRLAEVACPG